MASMPTAGRSKIDIINEAARGVAQKIYELHGGKQRKFYLDMQTAHAIKTIYDALSPTNREKYLRYPITKMADIAWKLIVKHRVNPKTFHIHYPSGAKPCRICGSPRPAARVAPLCDLCLRKMGYDTPSGRAYKRKPAAGWSTRNPNFPYVYRPGALDLSQPTVIKGRPIAPHTLVRVLAKRPAGGKSIRGWGATFAWIMDLHGNEQIVFRRALQKTSAHGY